MGITTKVDPKNCNLWTSPLHQVPKPDGTLRSCGDFRVLNEKTLIDSYPLPNLRHFTGKLRGSTVFSKIDLTKAYHQTPLDEASQKKATVLTPWGAWQFRKLAMGLRNAGQSFQRLMDHIFGDMPNLFVYMDDLLIYSENEESHLNTVEEVLKRLQENGLSISIKKCVFGAKQLEFVGYNVNSNGIEPLPRKLTAIASFPPPLRSKSTFWAS